MTLIGPLPKHPNDPVLPTPWKIGEGEASNRIYDANDRLIAEIEIAGITWKEDEEVALEMAKAVNRAFEPATVRSELRDFNRLGRSFAFEVEPGWAVFASSRTVANVRFREENKVVNGENTYGIYVSELRTFGYEETK